MLRKWTFRQGSKDISSPSSHGGVQFQMAYLFLRKISVFLCKYAMDKYIIWNLSLNHVE